MNWLVESRSRNQTTSLALYELLEQHSEYLSSNEHDNNLAQGLISACFSLWRAVFLSDVGFTTTETANEGRKFLKNLILHNSVTYMQDYTNREWSFIYCVNNAAYRFQRMNQERPDIVENYQEYSYGDDGKEFWTYNHELLEKAVGNFSKMLLDR